MFNVKQKKWKEKGWPFQLMKISGWISISKEKKQNNRTLTFINLTLYIKINSKWTIDLSIKNIK